MDWHYSLGLLPPYLESIWNRYLEHGDVDLLRDDIQTDPWYESPPTIDQSLLRRAVMKKDANAVRVLLSLGESPNLPAMDGFTLLHSAVDEMSDKYAPSDGKGFDFNRPRKAALAVISALLEGGADPNAQGVDGTPLHRAAGSGLVDAARILLTCGADIEARMLIDGELTPLLHAAVMGQPEMVRFLLDSGADRRAMSRTSLIDPPMNLRNLLKRWRVKYVDEILAMLDD